MVSKQLATLLGSVRGNSLMLEDCVDPGIWLLKLVLPGWGGKEIVLLCQIFQIYQDSDKLYP
jgi:hypothetical protein